MNVPVRDAGYLPLEQYLAIGDGRTVALVGADGSIDWWCVPNLDDPPLFSRLLDPHRGGSFSITPVEPFTVARSYRNGSNVVEHVFTTASGSVRLTDSLNSGISGRLPWSELARRIDGIDGFVELRIEALIATDAAATTTRETTPHGPVLIFGGVLLAFRSDESVVRTSETTRGVTASLRSAPGHRSIIALLATRDEPLILPALAMIDARIDRSDQSWREWSAGLRITGAYAEQQRRSALALKLLLVSETGAIAAAATTSLPERIGGKKNYDYRYAWVRDVAYSIKAFLRVGATEEAKAAFAWLTATIRRHSRPMRIMYTLSGDLAPRQRSAGLPGYRNTVPVVTGNKARSQLQLGVFCDVIDAAALFVQEGHVLDPATRRLLEQLADTSARMWRRPDAGIWELPQKRHYTISKIGCWTALDRAISLADMGQLGNARVKVWRRARDRILAWIDARCWSEARQSYTMAAGDTRLDAALMLALPFGFPRHDRLRLTRNAIIGELSAGPHVYRYTGMQAEEGAFTACSFWLVEATALLDGADAARAPMDALLAALDGNSGLLNEQIDPGSGGMLGNMPQALSHLALIHASNAIEQPELFTRF